MQPHVSSFGQNSYFFIHKSPREETAIVLWLCAMHMGYFLLKIILALCLSVPVCASVNKPVLASSCMSPVPGNVLEPAVGFSEGC